MNSKKDKSDKIKHLTSKDIEELYERYLGGEKVSSLINHYKIDISPNYLIKILPPKKIEDKLCEHCNEPMFIKRKSKNTINLNVHPIECYHCEHKIYTAHSKIKCECNSCIQTRLYDEYTQKNKDRNRILLKYNTQLTAPLKYSELKLSHKLFLLTLFRIQTNEKFDQITPLKYISKANPLSPTDEMDMNLLMQLSDCRAIIVNPESDLSAFDETNDFNSYYMDRVSWLPNISLNNLERLKIDDLYNIIYDELCDREKNPWKEEIFELSLFILKEEVLHYIHIKSKELNVEFTAKIKTRSIVEKLLNNFSVSEIYYFAHKAVESAHLYYKKGLSKGKKHAANTIPNKMLSLGERALTENWNTYKFNRDSRAPRSWVSKVFFDFFLHDDGSYFYKSLTKYWDKDIYTKHFSEDNATNNVRLLCSKCNSKNITITIIEENLRIICDNCKTNLRTN